MIDTVEIENHTSAKKLVIIGGPNGSGKSTFAFEYIKRYQLPYLGADAIAAELNPADPFALRVEAGKQFIHRLDSALLQGSSLVVESTLSGKGLDKHLYQAKSLGYLITIIFVTLDTPELSIARVKERVANGGHAVPDEDVRRRFYRSRHHFWYTYRQLAGEWQLFRNQDDDGYNLIALGQQDNIDKVNPGQLALFLYSLETSKP